MARGFLSGVIWGTVTAGLGLSVASLSTEVPGMAPPQASAEVSEPKTAVPAESPVMPDAAGDAELAAAPAAGADAAEAGDVAGMDTRPAGRPAVVTEAPEGLAQAETEADSGAPEGQGAPEGTARPSAGAAPVTPEVGAAPEVSAESATPQPAPEPEPAPKPQEADVAAEAEEAAPTAEAEAAPEPLPDEDREEIVLVVPEAKPETPKKEADAPVEDGRVALGTPAKRLGSAQSPRLPSVGVSAGAEASAEGAAADAAPKRPFEAYAAEFDAKEGAAKMAIVLIDDGTSEIGLEALSTFPYPLSFAVDSSWEGAAQAMKRYREAGYEVLAMVNLPRGAAAQDVEVSLPVLLGNVPEAMAVMETPDAGLQQASRDVVSQVTDYVRASGHGLLFFPKGLNTARKLAQKDGVPAATVFRDFDGKGQNASSIKRFLSHAALKAGTEGGVVMVGRLRATTISALLLWGLQDRAEQVQLSPVSQLMGE